MNTDEHLAKALEATRAEIVRLQAREVSILALLGSQPGTPAAPAGTVETPDVNANVTHRILAALSAASPQGLPIGEIATAGNVSKDVARRIMAGLAVEKRAVRKGDRALARWYAK